MRLLVSFSIILFFFNPGDKPPTIHDMADELAEIFYDGRHIYVNTESNNPYAMVREYILDTNDYEEEEVREYKFTWWSKEIYVDEQVAGTLKFGAAIRAVTEGTDFLDLYENNEHNKNIKRRRRAQAIMRQLKKKGAVFGFDGFWQSACAAPTPMLLIMDKKNRFVYGIDLNPCME
jgi:hypothetical protein